MTAAQPHTPRVSRPRSAPALIALATLALTLATFLRLVAAESDAPRWSTRPWGRLATLPTAPPGKSGFTRLAPLNLGIRFTNSLAENRSLTNRNLLSGSGVALGDVDGDGRCDLYLCHLDGPNALYRNLGNWKFQDITSTAGVAAPGQDSTGAAFADLDGDGDLDLLVNALGNGTRLFINDGKGQFTENTDLAGLRSQAGATSLALADIDRDGDLDLYVTHFRPTSLMDAPRTQFRVRMVDGRPVIATVNGQPATLPEFADRFAVSATGNIIEYGQPDALYLNDGHGRFSRVSWTDGAFRDESDRPLASPPRDWGLAVQFHDLNGDGLPDLYVCNDLFTPDRVWVNETPAGGPPRFRALSSLAMRSMPTFSMGVDFADINRDGFTDFFAVDMMMRDPVVRMTQAGGDRPIRWPIGMYTNRVQLLRNALHAGRGDGTFAEIAHFAGVEASDWSWTPLFLDVDLDGYEDLLVTNGQERDFQNVDLQRERDALNRAGRMNTPEDHWNFSRKYPPLKTPLVAWRNRGNFTFDDQSAAWGFNRIGVSQGMASADLDNDGDTDLVINCLNDAPEILRNDSPAPRIAVRLKGRSGNTQGIGARLRISGGPAPQSQEIIAGGRYMSGGEAARTFAAGAATSLRIEVDWPSGQSTRIENIPPNSLCEILEQDPTSPPSSQRPLPSTPKPAWFTDASHLLNHRHSEEPFDDFERQPLLPHRLSQSGPALVWADLDGDGWEDLTIGAGKGGALSVFRNNTQGGWTRITSGPWSTPRPRDATAILALPNPAGAPVLAVAHSNWEDHDTQSPLLEFIPLTPNLANSSMLSSPAALGALAAGVSNGDGRLDLFVGGRVLPGRYPEPCDSVLLHSTSGAWVKDDSTQRLFANLGLVTSAIWSDLEGDGAQDLIVCSEWGSIRIWRNSEGSLKEWDPVLIWKPDPLTQPYASITNLSKLRGWWTSVVTADFDGDGRFDLVAGNWGLNSRHRASPAEPLRWFYGDFSDRGALDILENRWDTDVASGRRREFPARIYPILAAGLPGFTERFPTHAAYGKATIGDLLGDKLSRAKTVEAVCLAPLIFFNRSSHWEVRSLPIEANWSPIFGLEPIDFDGDGDADLVLGQNFFAVHPEQGRQDAGRGLLLQNDGLGQFRTVPPLEAGLQVYGDARALAACDYDRDGRWDWAVAQNGNATRLWHNERAAPALRVQLRGAPGNPTAVGASVRWTDGAAPTRWIEQQLGGGYLSQRSAVLLVARKPDAAGALEVRWPGGKRTTSAVPAHATEVAVNPNGTLQILR